MNPVSKLQAISLYEKISYAIELSSNCNCMWQQQDQSIFLPWLIKNGFYLLFDYVHLFKNICNSWITESSSESLFYSKGKKW